MTNPLVSIIVPVYNGELWLEECIESILAQDYENIELLLINDGSTDQSEEICKEFAGKDCRIQCYENTFKGVSSARNLGIENSRGSYLLFVDCDDAIEKSYVRKHVNAIKEVDMSLCGVILEDENSKLEQHFEVENKCYFFDDFVRNMILEIPFVLISAVWCKCYKRDIIVQEGLAFKKDISIGEDCLFNINYISKCKKIVLLDYTGYVYNKRNNNSLTKVFHPEIFVAQTEILKGFLDLYARCCSSDGQKSLCVNEWVSQVCGELRVVCKEKMSRNAFNKVMEPLKSDIIKEIDLSTIQGKKRRFIIFLVKKQAFTVIRVIIRSYC